MWKTSIHLTQYLFLWMFVSTSYQISVILLAFQMLKLFSFTDCEWQTTCQIRCTCNCFRLINHKSSCFPVLVWKQGLHIIHIYQYRLPSSYTLTHFFLRRILIFENSEQAICLSNTPSKFKRIDVFLEAYSWWTCNLILISSILVMTIMVTGTNCSIVFSQITVSELSYKVTQYINMFLIISVISKEEKENVRSYNHIFTNFPAENIVHSF